MKKKKIKKKEKYQIYFIQRFEFDFSIRIFDRSILKHMVWRNPKIDEVRRKDRVDKRIRKKKKGGELEREKTKWKKENTSCHSPAKRTHIILPVRRYRVRHVDDGVATLVTYQTKRTPAQTRHCRQ